MKRRVQTGTQWSATAAARFAREARAAAVRYLRSSAVALDQLEVLVRTSYEIHYRMHGNDPEKALAAMLRPAGYRPPFPDGPGAVARLLARDEAERLAVADLYIVSPDMSDVVVAAAKALRSDDVDLLDETDLPSPTGCLVLPQPVPLRRSGGGLASARARWSGASQRWAATRPAAGGWSPRPGCG